MIFVPISTSLKVSGLLDRFTFNCPLVADVVSKYCGLLYFLPVFSIWKLSEVEVTTKLSTTYLKGMHSKVTVIILKVSLSRSVCAFSHATTL